MKTKILIALFLICTLQVSLGQKVIAKIKYEEAEEAYTQNDYKTTVSKLDEVEAILHNTNPKVMYLRIMAHSKLIQQDPSFLNIVSIRKLCSKYLVDYENIPDNEDKYREVYKIYGGLKAYPEVEEFMIDGFTYHSVKIGNQTWMVENLNVTHFRNGDPIPNVIDSTVWKGLETGAYCSCGNDIKNDKIYGKLYNWYAVNDSRNMAPKGWHVPTDDEWTKLKEYVTYHIGNSISQAKALAATTEWHIHTLSKDSTIENNLLINNSSGFNALPGGIRFNNGKFHQVGNSGNWWSSTSQDKNEVLGSRFNYNSVRMGRNRYQKSFGLSVRCVKD